MDQRERGAGPPDGLSVRTLLGNLGRSLGGSHPVPYFGDKTRGYYCTRVVYSDNDSCKINLKEVM